MKTIGLWGVLVAVFVFSPASAQVPPNEEWSIEIVVSDVLFGNFLIFNGQPFVSFVEGGTLRYAVREATGWDVRDTGITNVTSGSLLDNNGQLALVFTRGPFGNRELFFSTFDGTRWSTPILISANVDTASIAVINGRPEGVLVTVAPTPPFSTELRYATFDGVSWQVEVIEPFQPVAARGLKDIGGQPAVAYNVSNIFTRYAAFDGTNWDVIEIDDTQLSYGTQLIEWNGDPLIAYSRFAPTLVQVRS